MQTINLHGANDVGYFANAMDYAALIEEGLKKSGLTAAEASRRAVGNPYFLYGILNKGHVPSVEKFVTLCNVLGISFSVGPPSQEKAPAFDRPPTTLPSETAEAAASERSRPPDKATNVSTSPARASAQSTDKDAGAREIVREEVAAILKSEAQAIRQEICEGVRRELAGIPRLSPTASDLEDAGALAHLDDGFGKTQETRQVEIAQYAAAAGGGADEAEERVVGTLAFCRQWMDRHALRPGSCAVIDVRGESMEPTLWNGASILFDRSRGEWRPGDIFVIRIPDQGLVVKRAGENEAGNWQLLSDHPAWEPAPYPDDAEIIGQVVWTARTLIEQ